MKNNHTGIEKFLSRLFLVLLSAMFTLIIADRISTMFLNPKKSFIEKLSLARDIRNPKPYVMFKGSPGGKAWKIRYKNEITDRILNELGYPEDAPRMPKPDDEYRIIVLGGSAAFMGAPSLPRLIQHQFEEDGCRKVKVYNFAVVSSVSGMELARLLYEAVNYKPDLVISYSGFNDLDHPFYYDPRPGYPFNYFVYESNPILESEVRDYPLVPLMAYGSNLARYFGYSYFVKEFTGLEKLREQSGYGSEEWRQAIADIYVQNMVKSHKVSQSFNARFIAFMQPCLYFKDPATSQEQSYLNAGQAEHIVRLRKIILEGVKSAEISEGLRFVDLNDIFDGHRETVFSDRAHNLNHHYPFIAREIYGHLLRLLRDENINYHCPE